MLNQPLASVFAKRDFLHFILVRLCFFLSLVTLVISCETKKSKSDSGNAFSRFQQSFPQAQEITASDLTWITTGESSEKTLLELIDAAGPREKLKIRQFYVRKGKMTKNIHDHLLKSLKRGVAVDLQLDFMFSVSALHIFDDLKSFENFHLTVENPPSKSFEDFVRNTYGVESPIQLIDAVIDANPLAVSKELEGTRLQGALPDDLAILKTPEVILGLVMKKVIDETGLFSLWKLKSNLGDLSYRFHDKLLIAENPQGQTYLIGGRGWADNFFTQPEGSLSYSDIDLKFKTTLQSSGKKTKALIFVSSGPRKNSAEYFEKSTLDLISSARKKISIYTPYFAPSNKVLSGLRSAVRKGVHVEILTNSTESSDVPLVAIYTYLNMKDWKQQIGGLVFKTLDRPAGECFHAKLTLVDDDLIWIGNANWDLRSFTLDSNSFVVLDAGSKDTWLPVQKMLKSEHFASWHQWTEDEIENAEDYLKTKLGAQKTKETKNILSRSSARIQL